jgi:hypothetical protein
VALLQEQDRDRVDWLVPIRHARMAVSAFTFYRGTARIMTADLDGTPTSGLTVQLGGDAHLSSLRAYASPERTLVVDANDFDETLPGPWEWDLKRLATSFYIAGQDRGEPADSCRGLAQRAVRRPTARAWPSSPGWAISTCGTGSATWDTVAQLVDARTKQQLRRLARFERIARSGTSTQALAKLAYYRGGQFHWRAEHPVLVPIEEMLSEHHPEAIRDGVRASLGDVPRIVAIGSQDAARSL